MTIPHGLTTWTAQEDEALIKLWNEGVTSRKIGEQLGKGRNAVIGRAYRLRANGHKLEQPARPRAGRKPRGPRPQSRPKERVVFRVLSPPRKLTRIIKEDTLEGSVPLMERTGCAWPVTATGPHRFCNRSTETGPYCDGHRARMYMELPPRKGSGFVLRARA